MSITFLTVFIVKVFVNLRLQCLYNNGHMYLADVLGVSRLFHVSPWAVNSFGL